MITMLLYGISILFSPGPVTILCIHQGLNKQFKKTVPFFLGVGTATFILFVFYGFSGELLVKKEYLPYLSILGCLYIWYLSFKIFSHDSSVDTHNMTRNNRHSVSLKDGLLMQLFNPKASLAALPIATVNFPFNHIQGILIILWSAVFFALAVLSPLTYCLLGQFFGEFIKNKKTLTLFNKGMAIMLTLVGVLLLLEFF